jgi:hypothetical protein
MKYVIVSRALALVLFSQAPYVANAGVESKALTSCADVFAKSLQKSYRLDYTGFGDPASPLDSRYTFDMMAHNATTGAPIAKATCSASRSGRVVEFQRTPL